MNSMGINSYIPKMQMSEEIAIPHIPNARELGELFEAIDEHAQDNRHRYIFAAEYQVLFRLYYCCGLRLSEGCHLMAEDVDLEKGILLVRQSKGRKDRLVFMADDVTGLCKKYDGFISELFSGRTWFFPGAIEGKPFRITSIDSVFSLFWNLTESSKACEKAPTVHSLRYAFICDRINSWMEQGISLGAMMPYLCRYAGHAEIDETMYYYHMVQRAFKNIREKDKKLLWMIPEVKRYER
jgi:integrase